MRFVALFTGNIQPKAIDPAISSAHFTYVAERSDRIRMAGGLRPWFEAPFCGALWIIEATELAEAQQLAADDPFTTAGLWESYVVYQWNKAPGFGTVTLE